MGLSKVESFWSNFCVSGIPSAVLFPRLVFKTFLFCDNGAKQPPGKYELHRIKCLTNKVRWEDTTRMDTVSFKKIKGLRGLEVPLKG